MTAKISMKVLKNESPCCTLVWASLTTVAPVTASFPEGSTLWMLWVSCSCDTPGWAVAEMVVKVLPSPVTCCAVGVSNSATVAPSGPSALPNLLRPTMVIWWVPVAVTTSTPSPTAKWCCLAVAVSMTTWSGPCGGVPSATWNGSSLASPV